jgi:hypothetical protein
MVQTYVIEFSLGTIVGILVVIAAVIALVVTLMRKEK